MIKVNRDRFLEEGYLVLRNVIGPAALLSLRKSYEELVERQRALWSTDRAPGDPVGGEWEKSAQPRVMLSRLTNQINEHVADVVEIWLHENIRGVSAQLLDESSAAVTEMMLMCSPVRDHGTADHNGWHRDLYPPFSAPVQAWVDDIVEGGPRYVQWNIPLYDDDVLWVIPGSHRRLNTDAENQQLLLDSRVPFPNGVQTHLKAGDGVVYILPILHWGSRYNTTLRRTIHGGFSTFTHYTDLSYTRFLSDESRVLFACWQDQSQRMQNHTELALRAALAGNGSGYNAALERLHGKRGNKGRDLSTIFLAKTAERVRDLKCTGLKNLSEQSRWAATLVHPTTLYWGASFADRFTVAEAKALWARFEPLDNLLQSKEELYPPGYENRPSKYFFYESPVDVSARSFIASWKAGVSCAKDWN